MKKETSINNNNNNTYNTIKMSYIKIKYWEIVFNKAKVFILT